MLISDENICWRSIRRVERVKMRERGTPLVSVIIPTYDSARTSSMALRSIKRQTYPGVEIIVVDRYSRDGTP